MGTRAGRAGLRRLLCEASAFGERGGAGELRWATAAYAAREAPPPPAADPRHHTVLLFPGGGAARVGMGLALRHLPAAKDLYALASDLLGWDVWRTCTAPAGGADELRARAEPAVLVTALAALERVRAERPAALERARAAAGPGVGELAALVFAGALPLHIALHLAAARHLAPALEVVLSPSARMPALLAGAREHGAARLVAYLGPGRRLLAGDEAALRWLEAAQGVVRARRTVHAALEPGAAAEARAALEGAVRAPRVPVLSCESGRALRSARDATRALWRGAEAPLRWEQALHALYARPPSTPLPLTLALVDPALRRDLRWVNARAFDASILVPV